MGKICLARKRELSINFPVYVCKCIKSKNAQCQIFCDTGCRHRGGGMEERGPSWIFIHDSDKEERGLMVLFFSLVFSLPAPWKFFCQRSCLQNYFKSKCVTPDNRPDIVLEKFMMRTFISRIAMVANR